MLCGSSEAQREVDTWKARETQTKNAANISYEIRKASDDLYYLDMDNLSNLADKSADRNKDPGVSRDAIIYKPLRNAVGHTSILSDAAKQQLNTVFTNIKSRLHQKLEELKGDPE